MTRFRTPSVGLVLSLFSAISVIVGPSAGSAQADSGWCHTFGDFPAPIGDPNALPNIICVTLVSNRGFRGYITFDPPTDFQLAGRFFVTLTRNGSRIARTPDYINPIVHPEFASSWPTAYKQTSGGRFCAKVWERRTRTLKDLIEKYCHHLP
jgi:hypothetical protein